MIRKTMTDAEEKRLIVGIKYYLYSGYERPAICNKLDISIEDFEMLNAKYNFLSYKT